MSDPDFSIGGLFSFVDFSHISADSLSYPSSYETFIGSRNLSLFDLDFIESSSSTEYKYEPIGDFVHPHEIHIPSSASGHFAQDEGYVTPDFDTNDTGQDNDQEHNNDPNCFENDSSQSQEEKGHSWAALLGCGNAEKPLLSNYEDSNESLHKILWSMKSRNLNEWHPHDPEPASVATFLNDLKYLLVGVPTEKFQLNPDSNLFHLSSNFKLSSFSDEFVKTYVEEYLVCGNAAKHLELISQNAAKNSHGSVYNALCQTVGVQLQGIRSIILSMDLSSCDLASVSYITLPVRSQMVMMSNICSGFELEKPPVGGKIIDRLFNELQSIPSTDGAFAIYSILQPCLKVYFTFLFKWIFKGEIQDAHQEFFIDGKFPHVISNSRNFWTKGFTCNDKLLPSFLLDLKDEILSCGKTMCLLKNCDPDNSLFQLIEESEVELNVCNDYSSFEEIWKVMSKYHHECKKRLGTRFTFSFKKSPEIEKCVLEAAAQAREKNMKLYEERRRKKLQEIADKKYKQLLDLKQQIENLNLKKEQEKRLREEVEREWLQQIKKEQELDMILEQTKQAKIGEFYKSLLEASQKKVALTSWKIKRSELHEQRVEYFRSENKKLSEMIPEKDLSHLDGAMENDTSMPKESLVESDNLETISGFFDLLPEPDSASRILSQIAVVAPTKEELEADKATDQLIMSFIENLDETLDKTSKVSPNVENSKSTENMSADQSNSVKEANLRAWQNDKDQASRNRVKVLSVGVNNILDDVEFVDSNLQGKNSNPIASNSESVDENNDDLSRNRGKVLSRGVNNIIDDVEFVDSNLQGQNPTASNSESADGNIDDLSRNRGKVLSRGVNNIIDDVEFVDSNLQGQNSNPIVSNSGSIDENIDDLSRNRGKVLSQGVNNILDDVEFVDSNLQGQNSNPIASNSESVDGNIDDLSRNRGKVLSRGVNNIIDDVEFVDSNPQRQNSNPIVSNSESIDGNIDDLSRNRGKVLSRGVNNIIDDVEFVDSNLQGQSSNPLVSNSGKVDGNIDDLARNRSKVLSRGVNNIIDDVEFIDLNLRGQSSNPKPSNGKSIEEPQSFENDIDRSSSPKRKNGDSTITNLDSVQAGMPEVTSTSNTADDNSSSTSETRLSEFENKYFINMSKLPLKTDILDQILSASETVNKHDSSEQVNLSLTSSLCIESVQLPLRIHTAIANYSLMKYFVDKLDLMMHLNFMKDYFMLHNAPFRSSFIKVLSQTLRDYKGMDIGQFDISFILDEALAHSSPNEFDLDRSLSLSIENAPKILDITDPELFDCFSLRYSVDWPLNIIITPDAISRYNTIFKFFLKLMYVDYILMNQFKHLNDRTFRQSPHYKKVCLFRHSMTQFIHPLACFISENVVESQFSQLLEELEKDSRIDSVYYKHVEFVKSVIFNCFLTAKSEKVLMAFKTLFRNVLQFNEALVQGSWKLDRASNQLIHTNFSKLQAYFNNFILLVSDTCDFLKKLAESGYQVKLNNMTALLSLNASLSRKERLSV